MVSNIIKESQSNKTEGLCAQTLSIWKSCIFSDVTAIHLLSLSSASLKLGIKILFEKIWATCNNFSPVFMKVKHLRTQFTSLLFLYLKWKQEVFFYSEADYLQKIYSIWKWHWRGGNISHTSLNFCSLLRTFKVSL